MSEAKWTNEQLEAITGSGCSMLVAAAAGAGKTAVLVERIIRKITDRDNPVDIDRLLVVTFTNAAATEMRERIADAISKELDRNPDSRRLQKQFTLLNKASITTIHSFCLEVIRNNFHCIELDPGFRIADETEATLMKLEALEETFEERYADQEGAADFLQLVECYGGSKDDRMLQDMVLSLYNFVQSHPWPELWLDEQARAFIAKEGMDIGDTPWGRIIKENVRIEIDGLSAMMAGAAGIADKAHGLDTYRANCLDEIDKLSSLSDSMEGTWDELCNAFSGAEFGRLPSCRKDADKEAQQQFKDIRDEVKKRLYKLRDGIFNRDSAAIAGDLNTLYPLLRCLSQLVLRLDELYSARKKQKSLVDFNDLEHFCLAILTERDADGAVEDGVPSFRPSAQAHHYMDKFEEVMVDEYQDSNLVQEVILNCVSRTKLGSPNVFMVGDVKQSIYRFRQARPELFLEKYRHYSTEKDSKERKIQLYRNFRSRKEVISGVNFIFRQVMSRCIGELDYTEEEFLNPGFDYGSPEDTASIAGGPVELHLLELAGDQSGSEEPEEKDDDAEETDEPSSQQNDEPLDAIQLEARLVAERIQQLMQPDSEDRRLSVYDRKLGGYRNAEYRDIVILLRTTRNWADVFAEELSCAGIPAFADTGTGYFRTIEVQTMLSLLQIIDNPLQDIPMLAVLRSPIAMFPSDALADIRIAKKDGSYYNAMKKYAEETSSFSVSTRDFLNRLGVWRKKALYMSTDELIWYLYSDTGYYSYTAAMPGGAQRQANLRILFERARQYEQTSYKGLFNFVNFIEKLRSSRGDMGSAKILGENDNVVRIMSIHKSKGLEFPVVFVSGCGKKFNMMDTNRSILVHQELGYGPDLVDPVRRISYPTLPKLAIRQKIRQETLSEEMRILYVALTRAREKLILTGTVKDLAKNAVSWSHGLDTYDAKLPEYETSRANCYLDWLGPAVARHKTGLELRELAGIDEDAVYMKLSAKPEEGWARDIYNDQVEWEVRLWNAGNIASGKLQDSGEADRIGLEQWLEPACEPTQGSCSDEVEKRLAWRYTWEKAAGLPAKLSVTELKRGLVSGTEAADDSQRMFVPPIIERPHFMEEDKGFTSAEKGTILHFVMQHLNLGQIAALADRDSVKSLADFLQSQVYDMVRSELLSEGQSEAVDTGKIERFLNSDIGHRLLKAERVYREIPFNIQMRCGDIYPDLKDEACGDEAILLQGVIDCCFEEEGSLVLLDYKTDYAGSGGSRQTAEKYRVQLDYYAGALEQLTGKQVKSRYIYLFWNGDTVEM